jgi:hypothetical protein
VILYPRFSCWRVTSPEAGPNEQPEPDESSAPARSDHDQSRHVKGISILIFLRLLLSSRLVSWLSFSLCRLGFEGTYVLIAGVEELLQFGRLRE